MNPLLKLENISYSYHSLSGETNVLNHISFSVEEGEFLAIVGPSGCGKTTLLSIIAGLITPTSGTVSFYASETKEKCPKVGYMLQHDHLLEWRSIYKNVTLGLEINHMLTEERIQYVNHLLTEYDLAPFRDKHPSQLSGGMKQRAALIRTLALDPALLLLDEPFSALDYQTRLTVSDDICRLIRRTKKTMILITHDLSEAISIADRIIVLTNRPAAIKRIMPIHLTVEDASPIAARNAPEFNDYLKILWEDLSNEKKK